MEFKKRIAENYPELFDEGNGGDDYGAAAGFTRKWGWYSSITHLAQKDVTQFDNITNLNVHKCLMYLAFEKEKIQLENQQIKRK